MEKKINIGYKTMLAIFGIIFIILLTYSVHRKLSSISSMREGISKSDFLLIKPSYIDIGANKLENEQIIPVFGRPFSFSKDMILDRKDGTEEFTTLYFKGVTIIINKSSQVDDKDSFLTRMNTYNTVPLEYKEMVFMSEKKLLAHFLKLKEKDKYYFSKILVFDAFKTHGILLYTSTDIINLQVWNKDNNISQRFVIKMDVFDEKFVINFIGDNFSNELKL